MRRIAIVGPGGAGKSTIARQLGERTGIPVIHLDQHFWKPGWVETPREEWRALQEQLLAGDRWIVDGNYGGTLDVRLCRADTVVILSRARLFCVAGALRRTLRNLGRAVQAADCPERIDLSFLRWISQYPTDSRPRLDAALAAHGQHLDVVELNSGRACRRFINATTTTDT
jgi:adenylate kinase family enzyme